MASACCPPPAVTAVLVPRRRPRRAAVDSRVRRTGPTSIASSATSSTLTRSCQPPRSAGAPPPLVVAWQLRQRCVPLLLQFAAPAAGSWGQMPCRCRHGAQTMMIATWRLHQHQETLKWMLWRRWSGAHRRFGRHRRGGGCGPLSHGLPRGAVARRTALAAASCRPRAVPCLRRLRRFSALWPSPPRRLCPSPRIWCEGDRARGCVRLLLPARRGVHHHHHLHRCCRCPQSFLLVAGVRAQVTARQPRASDLP